jgi:hypothetical protein
MKHASDLLWVPKDDSTLATHWKFDEHYAIVQCENFQRQNLPAVIDRAFADPAPQPFPVPQFARPAAPEPDTVDAIVEHPTPARAFVPFPDGFWAELQSSERQLSVTGPLGFF